MGRARLRSTGPQARKRDKDASPLDVHVEAVREWLAIKSNQASTKEARMPGYPWDGYPSLPSVSTVREGRIMIHV
eukprot:1811454-Pyramimonas_sp.AAC.1